MRHADRGRENPVARGSTPSRMEATMPATRHFLLGLAVIARSRLRAHAEEGTLPPGAVKAR